MDAYSTLATKPPTRVRRTNRTLTARKPLKNAASQPRKFSLLHPCCVLDMCCQKEEKSDRDSPNLCQLALIEAFFKAVRCAESVRRIPQFLYLQTRFAESSGDNLRL